MPTHYHRRVPSFGNLRISGYLLLPVAYRSLSRPSSAPSAKASTYCPFLLDLSAFAHLALMGLSVNWLSWFFSVEIVLLSFF